MSTQALDFQINQSFGDNQKLSAFFDFTDFTPSLTSAERTSLSSDEFTGFLGNSSISNDPSLHKCFALGATASTSSSAEGKIDHIINSSECNFTSGNFLIPLDGLNLNNISTIVDFNFCDSVTGGVLVGAYGLGEVNRKGQDFTVSSGFNVGVTDRGHLFLQYLNREEEETIKVLYDAELSKRNIIGISANKTKLSLSYFDYFNDLVKTLEVPVHENSISFTGDLLLGGANEFYQTDELSGNLNSFTIISGSHDPLILKDIGEASLSEYTFNAEQVNSYSRVTGYSSSIVYKTGITGYEYEVTGTLTIHTGRETFQMSTSNASSASRAEGEKYFKYYTFNNGITTSKYKEELGVLVDGSGYLYHPTGEDAYDTLGLNDVSSSIQTYAETLTTGNRGGTISIDLHGKSPLYGTLDDVSGVVDTPINETWQEVIPATSGVSFEAGGGDLFKDYIYYMGGRS
jgi:hypothetical protein